MTPTEIANIKIKCIELAHNAINDGTIVIGGEDTLINIARKFSDYALGLQSSTSQ